MSRDFGPFRKPRNFGPLLLTSTYLGRLVQLTWGPGRCDFRLWGSTRVGTFVEQIEQIPARPAQKHHSRHLWRGRDPLMTNPNFAFFRENPMVQAWPRKSAKNFLSQIRKTCAAMNRSLRDLLKNTTLATYGGVETP